MKYCAVSTFLVWYFYFIDELLHQHGKDNVGIAIDIKVMVNVTAKLVIIILTSIIMPIFTIIHNYQ